MSPLPVEVRAALLLEHAELYLVAADIAAGRPPALAVHARYGHPTPAPHTGGPDAH